MLIPILVLVLFAPILYLPGIGGFEAPKIALLIMVSASLLWNWLRQEKLVVRRPKSSLAVLITIGYLIIRNIWVTAPGYAWLGTENSHFGVIAWAAWLIILLVTVNWQPTLTQKKQLQVALLLSLIGMLLVIALQKTGIEGINWYNYDDPERGRNLIGSIGGSGHLGIFLLLIGLGTLPLLKSIKKQSLKYVFVTILIITATTILLTKSLSAIFGLLLALVLGIVIWKKLPSKFIFIGLLVIATLLPLALSTNAGSRFAVKIAPSLADRTYIWQSANQGLRDPSLLLFGSGTEQFQTVYDKNYPPERSEARALTEEHAHSLIYELLIEWGLVGLLIVVTAGYLLYIESTVSEKWYLAALIVWLFIAQVNIITLVFWPILLVYLILGLRHHGDTLTIQYHNKWQQYSVFSIAVFWILIASITTNSLIAFARNQDSASKSSADLDFARSINIYQRITSQPISNPFAKLQLAEAETNDALKNNDASTNAKAVITHISQLYKEAPTAKNSAIALKILQRWSETNKEAYDLYRVIGINFLREWPDNPQYKNIVKSLRGQTD